MPSTYVWHYGGMRLAAFTIVTNNELVYTTYGKDYDVDYSPISYVELLEEVRDRVHKGAKILTHPLSGSVKPNETPFKSIYVSKRTGKLDVPSLELIEAAIVTCRNFPIKFPNMSPKMRADFALIDCSLVASALSAAVQY